MENIKDNFTVARRRMVNEQLISRNITNKHVLEVFSMIPRHLFVDHALQEQAYQDYPLGIGMGQTISQPYIVALMTQTLNLKGNEKILEIGTGCGYQTAILANLVQKVYTVERIKALGLKAKTRLKSLGFRNIVIRVGDGTKGWANAAPFDGILCAAGSPQIPEVLVDQLKVGGRLIIPMGEEDLQKLVCITKTETGTTVDDLGACRFVKLVGKHGWQRQKVAGDKFKRRSVV